MLKTDDLVPAYICIKMNRWRTGPPEALQALMDPMTVCAVDSEAFAFRLFVSMETGDERYRFVNTGMWVGSGVKKGPKLIHDA